MKEKDKGAHEWMIEFSIQPKDLDYFTELLDNALKALNSDYEAKRYIDITLKRPQINVARKGLFYDWLKSKDKLGGQNKVPRLCNTRPFMDELIKMN